MANSGRIYQRTEAGLRVCEDAPMELSDLHRRILTSIRGIMHSDEVRAALPGCSEAQIMHGLVDLETLEFIESVTGEWLDDLEALGCMEPAGRS